MSAPRTARQDYVDRARSWVEQRLPLHPDLARALLADRDALESIRQAADAVVESSDGLAEDRERAAFELAALLGQYEAGVL